MVPGKLKKGDSIMSLFDRWNQLIDHLDSMRITAGSGISVQKRSGGTLISATRRTAASGSSGAAAETDGGPFAVQVVDVSENPAEPEWKVKLFNSTAEESLTAGLLTIGSYRELVDVKTWDPQEGTVYLDVTYNDESESYEAVFDLEESLPETDEEKRYILRLAEIVADSDTGLYTANQVRTPGDIEVCGRWVK